MQIYILQNRLYSATGSFGGIVSGATNASPIVITTSAAHDLIDGDQVQVTGVGGNTNANTLACAKVTGYSATTFALYSDAALTQPIAGNAAYTSGGKVSMAYDISGLSGDFTLKLSVLGLTAGKNATVTVQDSADGFVNDIVTRWSVNLAGGSAGGWYTAPIGYTLRSYDVPDLRIGVSNARLRLNVQWLDTGGSLRAFSAAIRVSCLRCCAMR